MEKDGPGVFPVSASCSSSLACSEAQGDCARVALGQLCQHWWGAGHGSGAVEGLILLHHSCRLPHGAEGWGEDAAKIAKPKTTFFGNFLKSPRRDVTKIAVISQEEPGRGLVPPGWVLLLMGGF